MAGVIRNRLGRICNLEGIKMENTYKASGARSLPGRRLALAAVAVSGLLSGCAVTAVPLTQAEIASKAAANMDSLDRDQEPVTKPIGLYEAMARAVKYNLDHRVEMMRVTLSQKQLRNASAQMLPQLVANAGYAGRDRFDASYSRTLFSGTRSAEPSTSSEKQTLAADLTFSWHVLDFGLSYVRAQQAADKALVAEEQKRKVANQIMEDVRTAYWRAISAERLLNGLNALEARVRETQRKNRALRNAGQASPLVSLTYERELVDIKRKIQKLERELTTARHKLAALMNLKPGTKFTLVVPRREMVDLKLAASPDEMMQVALNNRPEFREALYRGRINEKEARAALLEVLPGAQLYAGLNIDTNDLLFSTDWVNWGAKVGWNLMRVMQYPAAKASIEADGKLLDAQAKALTMAIMTQVFVARTRYEHLRREAATAAEYYNVQRKILGQLKAQANANATSEQNLIREEMNTLIAAVEFDIAYADMQNAFGAVYTSLGADPVDNPVDTGAPVDNIASVLRDTWRKRGDMEG